jgi:hypothetical protein
MTAILRYLQAVLTLSLRERDGVRGAGVTA